MRCMILFLGLTPTLLGAEAVTLFNGKDLTGWKLKKGGESLKKKAEAANKRFTVADGAIVVDSKVKGDVTIETEQTFAKNVTITFEFKPGPKCNNDLFLRGTKFDLKASDVKNLKEGEWNSFEIVVRGDSAEFRCNGASIKALKTKPGATSLGLRAEAGPIQFRKLEAKE